MTEKVLRVLKYILEAQEKTLAAIDNLNANVAALKVDVDALIAKPAGTPEAPIQAAADAVAALDAAVKVALAPPAA